MPSTPYDARGLLRSSIRDEDPVLFFEHKKMYRSVRGDVPDGDYVVPLGRAAITRPGTQVTVIAYGLMAHYALEAADRVAEEGISVEVVDLRTLRPLDKETVLDSVRKTGKCLVVYEDNRFGGYGAEVAAIVAEEAFDYLDGPVTRIAGPDVRACPTTTSSRTGSWSTRRRSPTGSASSPPTEPCGRAALGSSAARPLGAVPLALRCGAGARIAGAARSRQPPFLAIISARGLAAETQPVFGAPVRSPT